MMRETTVSVELTEDQLWHAMQLTNNHNCNQCESLRRAFILAQHKFDKLKDREAKITALADATHAIVHLKHLDRLNAAGWDLVRIDKDGDE